MPAPGPRGSRRGGAALPFVFVLDLDDTVFGDVTPLVERGSVLDLVTMLRTSGQLPKVEPDVAVGLDFCPDFATVLRPGFVEFFKHASEAVPRAHFFVYTCGTAHWAARVVAELEACTGVRFERPIFSREGACVPWGDSMKSLAAVTPAIVAALSGRYAGLKDRPDILADRVLFIDDRPDNSLDHHGRQLQCPAAPRGALVPAGGDLARGLPPEALRHPLVEQMLTYTRLGLVQRSIAHMTSAMAEGGAFVFAPKVVAAAAPGAREDDFWLRLTAAMDKACPTLLAQGRLPDAEVARLRAAVAETPRDEATAVRHKPPQKKRPSRARLTQVRAKTFV